MLLQAFSLNSYDSLESLTEIYLVLDSLIHSPLFSLPGLFLDSPLDIRFGLDLLFDLLLDSCDPLGSFDSLD